MQSQLTMAAARDLGRAIRFVRTARQIPLREVAKKAELSMQYVQQIETGARPHVSEEAYFRIAGAIAMPERVMSDFLLRARIVSALEQRGLDEDAVAFVWKGVEQRLAEKDIDLRTDLERVLADIIL